MSFVLPGKGPILRLEADSRALECLVSNEYSAG